MTKKTEILQLSNKIPNNWKEVKLNNLLEFITCGVASTPEYTDKDSGVLFLSAQNIDENFNISLKNKSYITKELHEKLTSKRTPKKEDVLYVRVGATIGKGAVVEIEDPFSVYVSLTHIRTIKKLLNPYFLNYFISNHSFKTLMLSKQIAGGGVGNLNVDTLKNEYIYRPPLREQKAIATYLDNKTSKIDSAVTELEKQKSLLIELKKSTINQAVTKGLDLTVPMKDSGLEWIGKVPIHWDIIRVSGAFNYLQLKKADEGLSDYLEIGDVNIMTNRYDLTKKEKKSVSGAKLAPKDTLLISTVRPVRGGITVTEKAQPVSSAFCSFKLTDRFLFYVVKNSKFLKELTKASMDTTYPTCKDKDICNQVIGLPNKEERASIVDYLDKKTGQIDQAIEVIDNQIAKMKEYKKTLINDVVTGKIKVV